MNGIAEGIEFLYKVAGCLLFFGIPLMFIVGVLLGHLFWH